MRPVTKLTIFGKRLALVALGMYWIAIFVGTHMPHDGVNSSPRVNDKIKHFVAYFLLGGLMCYVTTSDRLVRRFVTIGLLGMAYGALDELTQNLVPGRTPDPMDFLADSAGLWLAIGIYAAGKKVFERGVPATEIS